MQQSEYKTYKKLERRTAPAKPNQQSLGEGDACDGLANDEENSFEEEEELVEKAVEPKKKASRPKKRKGEDAKSSNNKKEACGQCRG